MEQSGSSLYLKFMRIEFSWYSAVSQEVFLKRNDFYTPSLYSIPLKLPKQKPKINFESGIITWNKNHRIVHWDKNAGNDLILDCMLYVTWSKTMLNISFIYPQHSMLYVAEKWPSFIVSQWKLIGGPREGWHINLLIISMTKLLDADWLRGVQLFH
jgi:hypothetical protein